jgi:hypothetical protein
MIPASSVQCAAQLLNDMVFARAEESSERGAGSNQDEAWRSNAGVKAFHRLRLSRAPCLATLTAHFYRNPDFQGRATGAADRLPGTSRPALNARAGSGSFANSPPGGIYREARRLAGQRPALAMALIGYCGHDDIENSAPTIVSFARPESRAAVLAWSRATLGQTSPEALASFNRDEGRTINGGGRLSLSVACPDPSSSFYAPRALDESADIPDELRQRIASTQAPTRGAGSLPAKAYHISFAATTACLLASCGLTEGQSRGALEFLATRYRIRRLDASTSALEKLRTAVEDQFDINWADTARLDRLSAEADRWLQSPQGRQALIQAGATELLAANRARVTWSSLRRQIDAATLYRGGQLGQPFRAEPLYPGSASSQDPFHVSPSALVARRPGQSFCPGWSESRCNAARGLVDTWRTDLDWTREQQAAGARFGHAQCAGERGLGDQDDSLEVQACAALNELAKGTEADTSGRPGQSSRSDR